jgi:putative endonuclease
MRLSKGNSAEQAAKRLLIKKGLKPIAGNYRYKAGEIDLIMSDGEILIFIEVRLRSRSSHGTAAESITRQKQKKIIKAAQNFLLNHPQWQSAPCRFDAMVTTNSDCEFQWIKDAFTL